MTLLWGVKAGPFLVWEGVFYSGGKAFAAAIAIPFLETVTEDNSTTNSSIIFDSQNDTLNVQLVKGSFGYTYLIIGSLSVITSICYMLLFKANKKDVNKLAVTKTRSTYIWDKWVIIMYILVPILSFCISGIEFGYGGLLPTYLHKYRAWPKQTATVVALIYELAGVGSSIILGITSLKVPAKYIVIFTQIIVIASGVLLAIFQNNTFVNYAVTVATGFCTGPANGIYVGWLTILLGASGRFHALYWAGYFGGICAIPFLVTLIIDTFSPDWFVYVTLVIRFLSLFSCILVSVIAIKLPQLEPEISKLHVEPSVNDSKDKNQNGQIYTIDKKIDHTQL